MKPKFFQKKNNLVKETAFAVIPTNDNWFGVTYKEDKQMAIDTLNKHIENGVYPKNLWS